MSDAIGIMQHAIGSRPDPAHGYCTDDVARALQVDLLHQRTLGWSAVADQAWHSLDFLTAAFDSPSGRFRNFRSVDGTWIGGIGSEDSHGRAIVALADVIARASDDRMVEAATSLFARALPAGRQLTALRAQASVLVACTTKLRVAPDPTTALAARELADRFQARFLPRAASAWPWPERRLTYENALPARALIEAGETLGVSEMTDVGLTVLDWLIDIQTAPEGHLSPIGNGWWTFGGEKAGFDQQPIEATTLLLAAESAYGVTRDARYRAAMERAYAWFLGTNDLGLALADPAQGASADGLTPTGVNTNQGAESTLMWLTAAEHIRAIRDEPTTTLTHGRAGLVTAKR